MYHVFFVHAAQAALQKASKAEVTAPSTEKIPQMADYKETC